MKSYISFLISLVLFLSGTVSAQDSASVSPTTNGPYTTVIEGFDWGPDVSRVILTMDEVVSSADKTRYLIEVTKSSEFGELPTAEARGERKVLYAYVSDAEGNIQTLGNHITLVLLVAPNLPIGSVMHYFGGQGRRGNEWVDYRMIITDKSTGDAWTQKTGTIKPLVDRFDIDGTFSHDDITLKYAFYKPESKTKKSPLIIWLHGGGEGGTDPTLPLLANRAANYASDDIQFYFSGAYVLVPQCPGAWMDNREGVMTNGRENDIYNQALLALIKDFVSNHPGINSDRIYVGGCSNGGYMSLKLILLEPDYFAAGFISSLAYESQYISDEKIESIKDVPIWFVHSADDPTTLPELTVLPVYKRLVEAGAKNVHLSYYDHVVDITGFFGGDDYHYYGHFSWIYLHANKCRYDYDGKPVMQDGRPVTIMEWLAGQRKE